ncbi:SDR family NAD(P)-dependent oxidoreductase [Methylosinus sp. Sm6]|uniref:SDR family NAD(P)-dependent oxidoreductase n=1 Tax=Methylosinus sp. Sm6 TaxID=2866948 RepID=UPI001C99BE58|nr:SDR family NAD(P)-dependent oxidoreductase [Methylosinus sp. Sm6]MBY6241901.1 SDR family NAD(P)-dependent oxidoreductase [Methylosinus sp. Sm6]
MSEKRAIVVTGVSSGIGHAVLEALTREGYHVFGSIRREADSERLANLYGAGCFTPLLFDVTDAEAVARAGREVERRLEGATLAGLVNNAGAAFPGPLLHQPLEEFRRQIEVNLIGQLAVTQAFAPLLGASEARRGTPGRIVNMSSVAGSVAAPFLGAYAASKHALEAFSDSLRRELMIYGVDVVVIEPGVVATPIWDKAEQADFSAYEATAYGPAARRLKKWAVESGRIGPPPDRVAAAVLRALRAQRPPARIRVVPNYLLDWVLPRMLPARLLDRIIARRLGLRRQDRRPPQGG